MHRHHRRRLRGDPATLPLGTVAFEPLRTAKGCYFIWLDRTVADKQFAERRGREDLSDTILGLTRQE